MRLWQWFQAWASPGVFYERAHKASRVLFALAWLCIVVGLAGGLFVAPIDAQQGETFRIIYVHVPCAFFSLSMYVALAISAVVAWVFHIKVADLVAVACARWGAALTALALLTGALWGKPMWGTAWVWDARLTSELILLFLFIGYLALRSAISEPSQAAKASALLAVMGIVDLPIIHYSVKWWNTLHQGPTLLKAHPAIATSMLWPLLVWLLGMACYSVAWVMAQVQVMLLERYAHQRWVAKWRSKA